MFARGLQYSIQTIRGLKAQITMHEMSIQRQRADCEHRWRVHSHYPKSTELNGDVRRWWVHLSCTVCEHSQTTHEEFPVCETCLQPLHPHTASTEDANAKRAEILLKNKYATHVHLFRCDPCDMLFGFPVRADERKK